ncbi:hypothetical protein [Zavarzinia compransoris]|uniref:Uncharacterized protein n=1 Tax=Zavarzinia compransoris TaxID=1264899 RepID=A0A317E6X5_9PROT|nr:hypothetical protein [Zavarzinia compransoris]PWR20815.1 hypothetical protein DKG75_12550 [Zavarzinia compransoris]TDP44349.1 hypothetical protein DES42_107114 [Zavarzinia compransoris]
MRLWLLMVFATALAGPLAGRGALADPSCDLGSGHRPDRPDAAAPAPCLAGDGMAVPLGAGRFGVCRNEDGNFIEYLADDAGTTLRPEPGFSMGSPADVLAYRADVDGDGAAEIVTARLNGISNGLGVSYWTVTIAGTGAGFATAASSFTVNEFGPEIFAPRIDGKPGCRVLATEWQGDGDGLDGTWFFGRWYDVVAGGLDLAPAGEARRRRLLNSFDALWRRTADALHREHGLSGLGTPLAWLSGKAATAFDPRLPGPPGTAEVLTVTGIEYRPDPQNEVWPTATLVLRDAAGAERSFPLSDVRVGSIAERRLWPQGYRPADLAAWAGRSALYEAERADGPKPVLWLK